MSVQQAVQDALQANKEHQQALKVYTERLQAELDTVDKLVDAAESVKELDTEQDATVDGLVVVPGAMKPVSLVTLNGLLSEDSPFHSDAQRRQRYLDLTTVTPMKAKENEALLDAVRMESHRMHALDAQRRGEQAFSILSPQREGSIEIRKDGINWGRVAAQVSSAVPSGIRRSEEECRIRWLGHCQPDILHDSWSEEESTRLKELVERSQDLGPSIDWVEVANLLGRKRTPIDCMRHGVIRKTHTWNKDYDKKLLEAVGKYGVNNWALVARMVSEDASPHQCQKRFIDSLDPSMKRGPWSTEEDEHLCNAVGALETSWQDIALFVPGRTNNQCRERYQDRLLPNRKGKWTEEEDARLLEAIDDSGRLSWKAVSKRVGNGRTDNMCRKRYETIKKQAKRTKIT